MVQTQRISWIDHLRAGVFLLLLLDHSIHAYAQDWGRFHFFSDFTRSPLWDVVFMHDNSVIMPLLFFIAGMFVFPSFARRGLGGFWKERLLKLGVPYLIGIPFVVPLLSFPRYQFLTNPLMGYWEFWTDVYFQEKLQGGGPFWVLYCLALFTCVALILDKIIPGLRSGLTFLVKKAVNRPVVGGSFFVLISMILLGVSDILWGAPWWIGFGHIETNGETLWVVLDKILNLFRFQGSRFMLNAFYFATGIALTQAGLTFQDEFWARISRRWGVWCVTMIAVGAAYIGYSLSYFTTGAYNDTAHRLVEMGGTWAQAWPVLQETAPKTLIRTSLHGVFCFFQVLTYVGIFHRFFQKQTPFWRAYTPNAYGIFLLHEIPVIWLQYYLADWGVPIFVKILLVIAGGLGAAWLGVWTIRRLGFVRRVLG